MRNHRHPSVHTRQGFTLIEVMIALVILATLGGAWYATGPEAPVATPRFLRCPI